MSYSPFLDTSRLHRNVEALQESSHLPRQAGKTTTLLYLLIGELELGDPDTFHLIVTATQSMGNRMLYSFSSLLTQAGIKFQFLPHIPNALVTEKNQRVMFAGFEQVEQYSHGIKYRTIAFDIPEGFDGMPAFVQQYIQSYLEE